MPDSRSRCGEPIAPAHRIVSFASITRSPIATPLTWSPSTTSRVTWAVAMPADVDHRVEAARAADPLAARPEVLAVVALRLRRGRERPVERRAPQGLVHARRADLERAMLGRPGLDQHHLALGIRRQPIR